MNETNYIFFCHENGQYGFCSQWSDHGFVVDRVGYENAEQAMMHKKAMLFGDITTAEQILTEKDPRTIKNLGRRVANYNQQVWDAEKYEIVLRNNLAKFTQNSDILEKLCATKGYEIVEAASYDRIWGIGFSKTNALQNKQKWGQNLLGKALMDVRSKLC